MATKPFVTVSLMLHGMSNSTEITDYVDDNGRFVNIGTQVAAAIARREQIDVILPDVGEVIIPFHAIVGSVIIKSDGEYTPAEDAFCHPLCPEAGCNVSYTISFYDGEELLQTGTVKAGEVPTYTGVTPSKEGYTFLGWNTDSSAATALETLPAADGAATYYAIFEANGEG